MAAADKGIIRRNIELTKQTMERLDRLQIQLESSSHSDVMRKAVKVLERIMMEQNDGAKLVFKDKEGEREFIIA